MEDDSRPNDPSPAKNGRLQSTDSIEIPPICLLVLLCYTDANLEILWQLIEWVRQDSFDETAREPSRGMHEECLFRIRVRLYILVHSIMII